MRRALSYSITDSVGYRFEVLLVLDAQFTMQERHQPPALGMTPILYS